jgi:hypothetical protein
MYAAADTCLLSSSLKANTREVTARGILRRNLRVHVGFAEQKQRLSTSTVPTGRLSFQLSDLPMSPSKGVWPPIVLGAEGRRAEA